MIKFFVYTDGAVAAVCDCKKYADIHADYFRLTGRDTVVRRKKTAAAVYQKTIKNHLLKIVNDDDRYALALFEKDALLFAANVNDLDGINSQIDFINKAYRTEFKQLTKIQ